MPNDTSSSRSFPEPESDASSNRAAEAREAAIKPLVDAGMTREQAIELIRAAIRRATR